MKWRLECQTCKHASCYGYGLVAACDKDECKYEPYQTAATSASCEIVPLADVAPVVHARWVDFQSDYGFYKCSNCGDKYGDTFYNYCPHCGAKMDKKENEK